MNAIELTHVSATPNLMSYDSPEYQLSICEVNCDTGRAI